MTSGLGDWEFVGLLSSPANKKIRKLNSAKVLYCDVTVGGGGQSKLRTTERPSSSSCSNLGRPLPLLDLANLCLNWSSPLRVPSWPNK